ncbi:MAG: class I SAM-dependent methyltransferase [Thermoanaerobaculia bacterium]
MLRRAFRYFVPRRKHPLMDALLTPGERDYASEFRYQEVVGSGDAFISARYAEGMRWRHVLDSYLRPRAHVLDVGAGNGGIELALAAGDYRAVSIEAEWNDDARRLGVRRVVADAAALPFRAGSFDAALSLETIEHLADARASSRELARVLRDGATVLLTTPPRWRYALARDPHFGIRFLTLLPARMQRWVAARHGRDEYVDRIYGSVGQIARAMRPLRLIAVFSRSRMPQRWFWDALVFKK